MKIKPLIAACAMSLQTTQNRLVIIPEGVFRALDGRPLDAPHWVLTPEMGHQLVAALNQRQIDMVIDYEHATLKSQSTGDPAPAAGWLKPQGWEYVDGIGICSSAFAWTAKAQGFIESEEYKYLSPVFLYSAQGDVLSLLHVALTNTPALDQLPEAKLAAAAQHYLSLTQTQESEMDELLEQLRWMLNLPLTATAEDIHAELGKLQAQISQRTGVAVAANSQNLFDAVNAIEGLKLAANSQTTPDPSQYVPMAVYQEALSNASVVTAQAQAKEMDDLIMAACSDGRLTGTATIDWIKGQAVNNAEFVKSYLAGLPKIAALTQQQTQTVNIPSAHQSKHTVDDVQDAINAQFGI